MSTIKKILINKDSHCQSIWFMRQAGRYLPEFREIREKNKDFIKLCLNSNLSSDITLQPISRYDLDSAIIFSDILLVPYALGQKVEFYKDVGPVLDKFNINIFSDNNETSFFKKLEPIYNSIKKTKKRLNKEKSLIAFVGAPWTLLTYMMGLKKNKKEIDLLKFKHQENNIKQIINKLTKYLCIHIKNQINAGADLVQVFDSWAGLIPENKLEDYCYKPNLEIVNFCKERKIPIICFPKGIGKKYIDFQKIVKPDGLSLDYDIDPLWAEKNLKGSALQGGMNPNTLLKSDQSIYNEAKRYLDTFKNLPYIFNLGHGILPETSTNKLGKLIKFVRNYK